MPGAHIRIAVSSGRRGKGLAGFQAWTLKDPGCQGRCEGYRRLCNLSSEASLRCRSHSSKPCNQSETCGNPVLLYT